MPKVGVSCKGTNWSTSNIPISIITSKTASITPYSRNVRHYGLIRLVMTLTFDLENPFSNTHSLDKYLCPVSLKSSIVGLTCKKYFNILNHIGVTHECEMMTDGQTDGRTDIIIANATLNYAAQPIKLEHKTD